MITDSDPQEYIEFLQKFEVKKTTDSCFTPAEVYQSVLDWTVNEYGLHGRRVVRPFVPDGDYQAFEYQDGDVVIDNPPFSIFTEIMRFYQANGVEFFLFGPALTLMSGDPPTSIVVGANIEYANGAKIATSFATNMDKRYKVRTAPELKRAIEKAIAKSKQAKTLPKYIYPDEAITAARLGKISSVDFGVPFDQCSKKMGRLEAQKESGKAFFGGGYLISELKAAELKAAELKAKQDAIEWSLSDSEKAIIRGLAP